MNAVELAAALALLVAVAVSRATPQVAQAQLVDVGSHPVQIAFRFPQHDNASTDPSTWTQLNLSTTTSALLCAKLAAAACGQVQQIVKSPLLAQPMIQRFDAQWSQTTDKNGKTTRDRTCDEAKQQIASAISDSTGQKAYNIACNFPTTGTLSAAMGTQPTGPNTSMPALFLSYDLAGNKITFTVTKPNTCTGDAGTVIGRCPSWRRGTTTFSPSRPSAAKRCRGK